MLDNDQYKFTMQNALLKLGFAAVPVEYKFHCRTEGINFAALLPKLNDRLNGLYDLKFSKDDLDYLRSIRHLSEDYIGFLKNFRFDDDYVKVKYDVVTNQLNLRIKGPWFHTILFEVPLLSIISETYAKMQNGNIDTARLNLRQELEGMPEDFRFSDFGTRRRHSSKWHEEVIDTLLFYAKKQLVGTSNLFLARKFNLTPIGTMAHEWLQAHQQLKYRLVDSQKMALENWVRVYRGDLGIALADIINTDAFLKDFEDPFLYKLFDGVREDSEPDPINFGHRIVNFYRDHKIDSKTKTIVFSNGLDFKKAYKIHWEMHNLIQPRFGIGTKLTNNWDFNPLNIVIKMVSCNGMPVAKISNAPGKRMCESPEFESYLKSVYQVD
jgi:nicotinate phosphoribosyltransferase